MTTPQEPGVVQVQMSGRGPDLFRVALFLEGVLRIGDVDAVLADLHLTGIEIVSEHGQTGRRLNLTLRLIEPPPP
jgi:hypothetical protein